MVNLFRMIALLCFMGNCYGQPYFDAAIVRGTISPNAGILSRNDSAVTYQHYMAGVMIPIMFKNDSSRIMLAAYTERWSVSADEIEEKDIPGALQALYFPVTYIKPISPKWTVAATVIPRWNGNTEDMFKSSFQVGASLLASVRHSNSFLYRFGVYYNKEFFGPLIFPLAGIDWKINGRNNLFGLLPQHLTWEHKVSNKFYWGAAYRMYNNSYRTGYGTFARFPTYLRIQEMQLLLSADVYLAKRIVFNLEAGHSLFRRFQLGEDVHKKDYYSDIRYNNNFIVKGALLYRLRLR